MKICYLFQDEYPWDVRVEKICFSLAAMGHEVRILSRNRRGLPRSEEIAPGVHVDRLPFLKWQLVNSFLNFPAFFSPLWFFSLFMICRRNYVSCIIVRDLPLGPLALLVGRLLRIVVILDMAENYPAMLEDSLRFGTSDLLGRIFRNPLMWRWIERSTLPLFDRILVVSTSSGDRVVHCGVLPTRVFVVGNTPMLDRFAKFNGVEVARVSNMGEIVLLYVGGLEEGRGLETVVRALPAIRKFAPGVRLVIGGEGAAELLLRKLSIDLDVDDLVVFLGWVDPTLVPSVIAGADIGIIPHFVTEHTQTTIPNKIFDFMAAGKPVIVSHARSLVTLVERYNCGVVFTAGDHHAFARGVQVLIDENRRVQLGEAGRRAVFTECNWTHDVRCLAEALREKA